MSDKFNETDDAKARAAKLNGLTDQINELQRRMQLSRLLWRCALAAFSITILFAVFVGSLRCVSSVSTSTPPAITLIEPTGEPANIAQSLPLPGGVVSNGGAYAVALSCGGPAQTDQSLRTFMTRPTCAPGLVSSLCLTLAFIALIVGAVKLVKHDDC